MRWWIFGMLLLAVGCKDKDKDDTATTVDPGSDLDADGYDAEYDCNDNDAAINPAADEIWYDGVDQDCDDLSDYDQDGDGQDRVREGADCDDENAAVFAGADELCDEIDNDCDGEIDNDAVDASALYVDDDGDGYGRGDSLGVGCEADIGQALADGDCNDGDAAVNPAQVETCNLIDDDCDGFVDDSPIDGEFFYADTDQDGYGDAAGVALACAQPEGYVTDSTDCDDSDALSYPGAVEVCDLGDNDCDGSVDEDASDPRTYYADGDSDGYGTAATTTTACGTPSGYSELDTDCNDSDAALNPGAEEVCDGIDNDCDAIIDTDSAEAVVYHPDLDGDGYGDSSVSIASCDVIDGYLTDGSDCDDTDSGQHPGVAESCDGEDNDCDGTTDPSGSAGSTTFYRDADGDGYGDGTDTILACTAPFGYADNADDCDDQRAAANPGNRESCDAIDNDCDGDIDEDDATDAPYWYIDDDGDSYGDMDTYVRSCDQPAGYIADGSDCDDADAAVNPDGTEADNLEDEDCDGLVDEDFVSAGDLIITEIARQPYTGGSGTATNSQAQWIEVLNVSARILDLSYWYLEEQVGDSFYISPDAALVLDPGEYAVLCYEDDWFASPSSCSYTWGDPAWESPFYDTTYYFDRDEDLVAIYVDGSLMDEVHWTYDSTAPCWPRVARYTMEFDESAAQDPTTNDDCSEWCQAGSTTYSSSATGSPDYGTPGAANGSCP